MTSPFQPTAAGVVARVRVTPRAGRDRVLGSVVDATGAVALKVAVAAPPEDGRANAALVALLARDWRVPKSRVHVVGGATARGKLVRVEGDPRALLARLTEWWRAHDHNRENERR